MTNIRATLTFSFPGHETWYNFSLCWRERPIGEAFENRVPVSEGPVLYSRRHKFTLNHEKADPYGLLHVLLHRQVLLPSNHSALVSKKLHAHDSEVRQDSLCPPLTSHIFCEQNNWQYSIFILGGESRRPSGPLYIA